MIQDNGQMAVPPGFRFHPTDEELLYYYLRKKVAYEPIDLDVIRDVDLNKLEPWDLKDKCRIGSGPQNDWYFFSHKDKKYPTGTRTNRATTAGFWKATGRDKAIHLGDSRRIGMRKTLVFYTGRAPHGQKTDWIMHEYRLDDDSVEIQGVQEEEPSKGEPTEVITLDDGQFNQSRAIGAAVPDQTRNFQMPCSDFTSFDYSIHLPQLLSSEPAAAAPFMPSVPMNALGPECSQNLMKLTAGDGGGMIPPERFNGDWSILDKLLASHQNLDQLFRCSPPSQLMDMGLSGQRFPFQYLGCESDHLQNFSK